MTCDQKPDGAHKQHDDDAAKKRKPRNQQKPPMSLPTPVSSTNSQSESPSHMQLAHLQVKSLMESFIRTFVDHLNTRSLPPTPLLHLIDPAFRAIAFPPFKFSWDEYIHHLIQLTEEYPEYRLTLRGIDSHTDVPNGHAHVFTEFELSGVPVGLVRRSVAVVRFRRQMGGDGDGGADASKGWRCFEYQATDGMKGG